MKKRAQVSIPVIAAITILLIISFLLYQNIASKNRQIQDEKDKVIEFANVRTKTQEYVEHCMEFVVEEGMEDLWVLDSDTLFAYINAHFMDCINDFESIRDEGYNVEYGSYTPSIEFTNDYLYVNMDFPVDISKFEQKATLNNFMHKQEGDYSTIASAYPDPVIGPTVDPIADTTQQPLNAQVNIQIKTDMPEGFTPIFENIGLKIEELTEPRPIRAYIVKVNVNDPDIKFFVTPPGEPYQSTEFFRQKNNLQVAINGDGHIVGGTISDHATGFGASEGVEYMDFAPEHPTMYFSNDNEVQFFDKPKEIWNAISGFRTLVKNGKLNGKLNKGHPDYEIGYENNYRARTSMGYDEENNILILVIVVEGGGYIGLNIKETGEFMLEHGATSAIDMDSGSSSTLAVQGQGVIAGGQRLVANHFGVYGNAYSVEKVY